MTISSQKKPTLSYSNFCFYPAGPRLLARVTHGTLDYHSER